MPTRRQFLTAAAAGTTAGLAGCGDTAPPGDAFRLTTPAFDDGAPIPARYTCRGANVSPRLRIESPPAPTEAFALSLSSPDSPGSETTYWLLWNVPGDERDLPAALPRDPVIDALGGARQGANDAGQVGYYGPCPPPATDATYWFVLSALDAPVDLEPGADRDAYDDALETHRLADVILKGTFSRSG
ncbi:MAG: YbhB/YbcL family Raf kinase inhibitor-like protein [Haloarculaceae archaeon]